MASSRLTHDIIAASAHEQAAIDALADLLRDADEAEPVRVDRGGARLTLPPSLRQVLREAATLLQRRGAIVVQGYTAPLTPEDAAELLGEPVGDVLAEIADGALAAQAGADGWTIALADLLTYKARREAERAQAVAEIIRIGEELEAGRAEE